MVHSNPRRQGQEREHGDAFFLDTFSVLPKNLAFLEENERIVEIFILPFASSRCAPL
jgi:hypothetical protein